MALPVPAAIRHIEDREKFRDMSERFALFNAPDWRTWYGASA